MAFNLDDLTDQPQPLSHARSESLKAKSLAAISLESRRRKRRRGAAAVAGAGTVAASVVALTLNMAPSATADWSATPQRTSIQFDDELVQQCLSGLSVQSDTLDIRSATSPILAETRRESTAALLSGQGAQGLCIKTPTTRTGAMTEAPALEPNQDLIITGNGGAVDDPDGIRYLYGRTSSRVASVVITRTDHRDVTASVADGSFMAWWPGSEAPTEVTTRDSNGKVVQVIHPATE